MPIEIKLEESYLFKKGEEKGEKIGKKRGEKRGERKTKKEMILTLLKLEKLSIEEIAKTADVSIDFVKKLAASLNK